MHIFVIDISVREVRIAAIRRASQSGICSLREPSARQQLVSGLTEVGLTQNRDTEIARNPCACIQRHRVYKFGKCGIAYQAWDGANLPWCNERHHIFGKISNRLQTLHAAHGFLRSTRAHDDFDRLPCMAKQCQFE